MNIGVEEEVFVFTTYYSYSDHATNLLSTTFGLIPIFRTRQFQLPLPIGTLYGSTFGPSTSFVMRSGKGVVSLRKVFH